MPGQEVARFLKRRRSDEVEIRKPRMGSGHGRSPAIRRAFAAVSPHRMLCAGPFDKADSAEDMRPTTPFSNVHLSKGNLALTTIPGAMDHSWSHFQWQSGDTEQDGFRQVPLCAGAGYSWTALRVREADIPSKALIAAGGTGGARFRCHGGSRFVSALHVRATVSSQRLKRVSASPCPTPACSGAAPLSDP